MTKQKYRQELKYYINYFDYLTIKNKLRHFINLDKNANDRGEYNIRSLYFDDINNSALFQKLSGIRERSKYRVRIYNYSDELIKLEKKIKNENFIRKEVAIITKEEFNMIIKGDIDFMINSKNPLLIDFYLKSQAVLLKPKVIVEYVREAYISEIGNVRITFDKNLKSGLNSTDLFNQSLPVITVLEEGYMILEVKYDEFLPEYIKKLIKINSRNRHAISKYAICRKYTKNNSWEDN